MVFGCGKRRFVRTAPGNGTELTKSIQVTDSPLRGTIERSEEKTAVRFEISPKGWKSLAADYPHYSRFTFDEQQSAASVTLTLTSDVANR